MVTSGWMGFALSWIHKHDAAASVCAADVLDVRDDHNPRTILATHPALVAALLDAPTRTRVMDAVHGPASDTT